MKGSQGRKPSMQILGTLREADVVDVNLTMQIARSMSLRNGARLLGRELIASEAAATQKSSAAGRLPSFIAFLLCFQFLFGLRYVDRNRFYA